MYIKVHVFPESKKESVKMIEEDKFEVFLKEKRERGEVNKRLLEIFKELFYKEKHPEVKIVSGHLHPSKILSIKYHD